MVENELRFSVSDGNGFRAASWKLWTRKTKSDFYLSCRELKGAIKASFHESGRWHIGYTDEALDKYFDDIGGFPSSKYIEIWPRPRQVAEGVTLAFGIITPFSAVKTPIIDVPKNIHWIPNCSTGMATEIFVIMTTFEDPPDKWMSTTGKQISTTGGIKLNENELVWVVSQEIPIPNIQPPRGQLKYFKGARQEDLNSEYLRTIVFQSEDQFGIRTLFDLAVNPPPPKE